MLWEGVFERALGMRAWQEEETYLGKAMLINHMDTAFLWS
jgi:hypothetical protein